MVDGMLEIALGSLEARAHVGRLLVRVASGQLGRELGLFQDKNKRTGVGRCVSIPCRIVGGTMSLKAVELTFSGLLASNTRFDGEGWQWMWMVSK